MEIDQKNVKEMKELLKGMGPKNALTPLGLERLRELSSYFLFVAVASRYTTDV